MNGNKNIEKIYVFHGNKHISESVSDLNVLFQDEPENDIFQAIFTPEELETIIDKVIPVVFIQEHIHQDDTIDTIKRKIIKIADPKVTFDGMYLFGLEKRQLNPISIYQLLTQNEKIDLTKDRLAQFLLNIENIDINHLKDKEIYDYDDILSLNLEKEEHIVKIPIGQKFVIESTFPYTVNPFDALVYDEFLEKYGDKLVSTLNHTLLLNTGNLEYDNLYLCSAEEVLHYASETGLSEKDTVKIYFPYMFEAHINSLDELKEKKNDLVEESEKLISNRFLRTISNVNLFYNIYYERKNDLNYIYRGIRQLNFTIHPYFSFNLPLDIIFKLIHVSEEIPLIKYNPGKGKEKIFKLYANQISKSGRKIPFLQKSTIFRLRRSIGKSKGVTLYIQLLTQDKAIYILCQFNDRGQVNINCEFHETLTVEDTEIIIRKTINPILMIVKDFLEQSGYQFELFHDLQQTNIEILRIKYYIYLSIQKNIHLKRYVGCLSSIFSIIQDNIETKSILRFKRVSNYSEMDGQDAMITEMFNQGKNEIEILSELERNFSMDTENAKLKLADYLSSIQLEQKVFVHRKLRIKGNPGFPVVITKDKYKNNILIDVDNINNINYLKTIGIYIDSLIRITQDPDSTKVPKSIINKFCKGRRDKVIKEVVDIQGEQEKGLLERKSPEIVAQELKFESNDEDIDDILDLLGDDDDEIEIGEEIVGGATPSTASESSLSSDISIGSSINLTPSTSEDVSPPAKLKIPALVRDVSAISSIPSQLTDASIEIGSDFEQSPSIGTPLPSPKRKEVSVSPMEEVAELPSEKEEEDEEDELKRDITGMNLTNPNYFFKRLEERDPKLFLKKAEGKFNAYSRICASNMRKQPVILTDGEKKKIDREHPGSYTKAIKYGSSPDKYFWYICPRYWCLKDNTSLTEEDVKAGKCGGKIIPYAAKKVPKDAFIYDFVTPVGTRAHADSWFDKDGNYIPRYPGFVKEGSHPNGLCVPCCFKQWARKKPEDPPNQQEKRREVCLKDIEQEEAPKIPSLKREPSESDKYIKGPDKFPLTQNRWGYLPLSIQQFFKIDSRKCQASKTTMNIKSGYRCILRKGVEFSEKQSFIACLADLIGYTLHVEKKAAVPSITQMKNMIISSLDLDNFITYQNGNLVTAFKKPTPVRVDISKYRDTKLVKHFEAGLPAEYSGSSKNEKYLRNVIGAYENFIRFLRDDDVFIDYTYLWDIVCQPNAKLFSKEGLNLVILNIPDDDVTNNVELICPTNQYSSQLFEPRKPTLILMSKDNIFEPIYSFKQVSGNILGDIKQLFIEGDVHNEMHQVLYIIKDTFMKSCIPLQSMPKKYEFKQNIILSDLLDILQTIDVNILNQVVSFNSKVIGVIAEIRNAETKGFIPCFPSAIIPDIPYQFMDDDNLWQNYESTVQFLKTVNSLSKNHIPCKPVIKIIEDGLVVGILTETNQFIPLDQPYEDIYQDDLATQRDINYMVSDEKIYLDEKMDEERIKYIKRIKLENNFFNVFRNTIRILLNKFEHRKIREEIEAIISKPYMLYLDKLRHIDRKLRSLIQGKIEFTNFPANIVNEIDNISTCINSCQESCAEKNRYCVTTDNMLCKLLIPNKNLISGVNNENVYFGRMSDELIRYGRIRLFIFKPQAYLSLDKVSYNLRDSEIILLDTLLTQNYFDNLVPQEINPYATYNTFDTAEPSISQHYSNRKKLDVLLEEHLPTKKSKIDCISTKKKIRGYWGKLFSPQDNERVYRNTARCSFQVILDLIDNFNEENDETINSIKTKLVKFYYSMFKFNKLNLLKILGDQGKKYLTNGIRKNETSLDDIIHSEDYFLSSLDIWVLAREYSLPIVLISGTKLMENSKKLFITLNTSDSYYFIKQPKIKEGQVLEYSLIESPTGLLFPIDSLRDEIKDIVIKEKVYETEHPSSPDEFIEKYASIVRKKKLKLVLKEPAQEEPAQEEPAQEEPAQEEPAQEEPAQEEPAQEEPVQKKPVGKKKSSKKLRHKLVLQE